MQAIEETATMGNEDRDRPRCGAHEEMIKDMTDVKAEVRHVKEAQKSIVETLETIAEKLGTIEKNMIWWGGALGVGGSILVAAISNVDKIKGLFS